MRRAILTAVLLTATLCGAFAQSLTNDLRRRMNEKLLELLNSYEDYSSFAEDHYNYSYVKLFRKADAPVYCDYVASPNYRQTITAQEYATYSVDQIHVTFIEVRNLTKGEYERSEGSYKITVEFDKALEYEDEIITYFSTQDEVVGGDFHVTMECWYDLSEKQFFILSIDEKPNPKSTFPTGNFLVVERKSERDNQLTFQGRPLSYNAFNFAIVNSTTPPDFDDEDLITDPKEVARADRYAKLNYNYKETNRRFKAYFQMAPVSAYSVRSDVDFTTNESSAYELAAEFGYSFPLRRGLKLVLYGGLGLSMSSLSLGVTDINYQYQLADQAHQPYIRSYHLDTATEGFSFMDAVVPLYPSLEIRCSPSVVVSVDAGLKLYLNMNTTVDPYSVTGQSTVTYPGAAGVSRDLPATIDQYMSPASYMRNTYDLVGFGRLGVDYRFMTRKYAFLRIGYAYGLTESYISDLNPWFNPAEGIYPFVYSIKSDTDVAVRSFADCISYRRAALTFDLGFRMNF